MDGGPECSICLEVMAGSKTEIGLVRSCSHIFHFECLWDWLCLKQTCPMCRENTKPRKSYIRQLPYGYIIQDSTLREAVRAASRLGVISRAGLCVHTPGGSVSSREHSTTLCPVDVHPGSLDNSRLSPGVFTIASTTLPDAEVDDQNTDHADADASVTLPGEADSHHTDIIHNFGESSSSHKSDQGLSSTTKKLVLQSSSQLDVKSVKSIDSSQKIGFPIDIHAPVQDCIDSQFDGPPMVKDEVAFQFQGPPSGKQTNRSRFTQMSLMDMTSTMTTVTD